ncbi:MAG TPA: tyrosine-type recombinase/integrase [Verrucomicrobiota bacterium]|nr:tyrosine-type recombinase/integrase [Verrucomicrobiota bacterium]
MTIEGALAMYEQHLTQRGNRPSSIERTMRRLRLFHEAAVPVADVTQVQLASTYALRVAAGMAPDTHRNELNETKTFWRWCVHQGLVARSPAEQIEGTGRRKRGKPKLRRGEARAFFAQALKLAEVGDEAALALATILILGLRVSEILERRVRDIDVGADGVLLWIDHGKTASAERYYEIPEPVAGLLAAKVRNHQPDEWLFPAEAASGHRRREWPHHHCQRICKLAGVPLVSPQGLRGTFATLAREAGVASHVVAREIGHADDGVTKRHYISQGADERARARALLKVVEGGSGNHGIETRNFDPMAKTQLKVTP